MNAPRELSLTLTTAAALTAFSGFLLLLAPGWFHAAFFGYPELPKLGVIRWSGGPVLGIALCFWLARNQRDGLRPVLALGAVGASLYVAALLYGYVVGETASPGPLWLYIVVYTVVAGQFWRLYFTEVNASGITDRRPDVLTRRVGMPR